MKINISLKTALFSIVFLASIVPLAVTAPWVWQRAQNLLLENFLEKEAMRNKVLRNAIAYKAEGILGTLKNKSDPLAFIADSSHIKTLLEAIIEKEELIDVVTILNREGSVVASASSKLSVLHNDDEYKEFFDIGGNQIVLSGRTYISPTYLMDGLWHFHMAVPVGPAGRPTGILFVTVDADRLWRQIQKEDGFLHSGVKNYVVNNYGNLFFASFETDIELGTPLTHIPIIRSLIAGKEWGKTQVYKGLDGKQVFAAASHVDLLNWGIVTEVPEKTVKGPVSKALFSLAAIITSIAFLFSAFSILLARRIAKPILELTDAIQCIQDGKDCPKMNEKNNIREFGLLAGCFNRTVSALKEKEGELQEAKERAEGTNRLKSDFLNMMSHELRTPLTVILGNVPILTDEKDLPEPKEVAEIARDMEKSGMHLLSLINDLLDISKIEAGRMPLKMEAVSTASIIEDAVSTISVLAQKKGIAVESEVDDMMIRADPVRLKQILLNLLSNAVKFTNKGGIRVSVERDGESAKIKVADTGCGIREDDFPVIFEPFRQVDGSSTRNAQGTGLGLAITKSLVELHGGRISVESRLGEGSVFTFTMSAGNMEERGSL